MVFSFSELGAFRFVHGIAEAIGPVILGAMLIGLPASIPFFVVSRLRHKPLWSSLGALIWFAPGGLMVYDMFFYQGDKVVALILFGLLTVAALAFGLTAQRSLHRPDLRPEPLASSRGNM